VDQLSFAEVGDILALIGRLDCDAFDLEHGDLRISLRRAGVDHPPDTTPDALSPRAAAPAESLPGPVPAEPDEPEPADAPDPTATMVAAPMTGTFYRSPAPGEAPCANVGDEVVRGQTVALIEVMKLFTELKAEAAGTVVRIDAEDGCLVEYGQPLMWIEPR
jgi:acetyl-CoA carboxylase biotin carboxyl carrier protein